MASILVTGANGFVGRAVCDRLETTGRSVKRAVRRASRPNEIEVGDIGSRTDWQSALAECDAIVHLAARVHVMHDQAADPLDEFREVNTRGTLNLARQAAQSGIKRFVFLSSVKVNGESGLFGADDEPAPQDAYGVSKAEAEEGLREIARETGMEVVILRPPLIYGPGVGANFFRLMRAVDKGMLLPFGLVKNRRSLVYLGNLVGAIVCCLDHPAAAGKTYLVSDADDVSTPELVALIANALGRSPRLFPVPPGLMRFAGRLLGKGQEVDRLLGSLAVDSSAMHRDLQWTPAFTIQQGLSATAAWYRERHATC